MPVTDTALRQPGGAPGGPVEDEPTFEARGIDYIPAAERRGRPADLLWMWAGALFGGGVYWLLARRSVPREAVATPA